jgi:hypothetical protein
VLQASKALNSKQQPALRYSNTFEFSGAEVSDVKNGLIMSLIIVVLKVYVSGLTHKKWLRTVSTSTYDSSWDVACQ